MHFYYYHIRVQPDTLKVYLTPLMNSSLKVTQNQELLTSSKSFSKFKALYFAKNIGLKKNYNGMVILKI